MFPRIDLAELFFSRNPARNWAESALRDGLTAYAEDLPEPMVDLGAEEPLPFELTRERIRPVLSKKTLVGLPPPAQVNTKRAGRLMALLAMAGAALVAAPAVAAEQCVQGEVEWQVKEPGGLESTPLEGLYVSLTAIPGTPSVLFTVAFLGSEVVCASTLTPGIGATVGCAFPGANATFSVRANGTAMGEICVDEPKTKAPKAKPVRAREERSTYDAEC